MTYKIRHKVKPGDIPAEILANLTLHNIIKVQSDRDNRRRQVWNILSKGGNYQVWVKIKDKWIRKQEKTL